MEIKDMLARLIWDTKTLKITGVDDSGHRRVLILRRSGEFAVWFEDNRQHYGGWEQCELCGLLVWDNETHTHYTCDEAEKLEREIMDFLSTGVLRLETISGETIGVRYL